jgi:hypothetical protein
VDIPVLPQAFLFDAERLAGGRLQPLNDPVWTDVYDHVRDDDPVLGLYLGRRAWALPWWIMKRPHVANLAFDDRTVLVTLCPSCSGASAFRAEVEGRSLVSCAGTYNGTMLLEDGSTGSLWSPFTGVALAGTMRGAVLERLPLSQCQWSDWLAMHPTTRVLFAEQSLREGDETGVPCSACIPRQLRMTLVTPLDERLPHNTLVLGVEHGGRARAYPLAALARIGPVLNDSLGGAEIVLRCRPGTLQALAFHRRVGDRILVFGYSEARGVYDEQTGSVWNEMGEAISGPLAGTQLVYFESGVGEWYEFAAYHPDAEIFEAVPMAKRWHHRATARMARSRPARTLCGRKPAAQSARRSACLVRGI